MYSKIKDRPTLSEVYTEQLIMRGDLTADETEAIDEDFQSKLQAAQQEVRTGPPRRRGMVNFAGQWNGLTPRYSTAPVETSVSEETLHRITDCLTTVPEQFTLNPKIARLLEVRRTEMTEHKPIDWAFAEALAFGSLLLEGTPVRLSGQDSRRGTFSQRHAVFYDARTGERFFPLNSLAKNQAQFTCYDSLLSEAAVLGFEFGFAFDEPDTLVLWEAQFGDFANGAQVIIDQYVVCSQSKWQRDNGLVMLLPHGYEGQGPEHSSARLERFLQACAEDNIQVCNLTTPAQYFHILRRQMKRDFRKPLILMTPKSMLRHKEAVSPVEQFTAGRFGEVLDDATMDPARVRRVLLCSGKVYYDLVDGRARNHLDEVAIVRVEQFYPLREDILQRVFARYRRAREWAWVQEESQNMGGWTFMDQRLRSMGRPVEYVGRDASASPATGSLKVHQREQKELVEAALRMALPHLVRAGAGGRGTLPLRETETKQPAGRPRS
jgi:2-oxoglutarate dehydrogenase E1 component